MGNQGGSKAVEAEFGIWFGKMALKPCFSSSQKQADSII